MEMADSTHDDGTQASEASEVNFSEFHKVPKFEMIGTLSYIYAYCKVSQSLISIKDTPREEFFKHICAKIEECSRRIA